MSAAVDTKPRIIEMQPTDEHPLQSTQVGTKQGSAIDFHLSDKERRMTQIRRSNQSDSGSFEQSVTKKGKTRVPIVNGGKTPKRVGTGEKVGDTNTKRSRLGRTQQIATCQKNDWSLYLRFDLPWRHSVPLLSHLPTLGRATRPRVPAPRSEWQSSWVRRRHRLRPEAPTGNNPP